jgi:hypothetical protein
LNTHGHFSDHRTIQVLTGFKECTEADWKGDNGLLCLFLGGIPIVKVYDSQVSSVLIMPGSSGSPVFNSSGYIAGLVFAGSGTIGFSFLVPQEYVYDFTKNEVNTLPVLKPNKDTLNTDKDNERKIRKNLSKYCAEVAGTNMDIPNISKLCTTIYEEL